MNENLQLALTLFLIHAAWQGTVIALLVVAADKVFGKAASTVRYRLFFLALLFMLLFPALTSLLGVPAVPIPSAIIAQPAPASEGLPAVTPRNVVVSGSEAVWLQAVQVSTQYLVPVWVIGVLAMTLRWTGASYVLRRRIRRSSPAGERWRETVDDLRRALRIERAIDRKSVV
jgi:BlaR1 peptidase M56.